MLTFLAFFVGLFLCDARHLRIGQQHLAMTLEKPPVGTPKETHLTSGSQVETKRTDESKHDFDDNELKKKKVCVENKILYVDCDGAKKKLDGKHIYIVDTQDNMYAHPEPQTGRTDSITHSNFLGKKAGKNSVVKTAGELYASDGMLKAINTDSGHYSPLPATLWYAVHYLVNNKIDLSETICGWQYNKFTDQNSGDEQDNDKDDSKDTVTGVHMSLGALSDIWYKCDDFYTNHFAAKMLSKDTAEKIKMMHEWYDKHVITPPQDDIAKFTFNTADGWPDITNEKISALAEAIAVLLKQKPSVTISLEYYADADNQIKANEQELTSAKGMAKMKIKRLLINLKYGDKPKNKIEAQKLLDSLSDMVGDFGGKQQPKVEVVKAFDDGKGVFTKDALIMTLTKKK